MSKKEISQLTQSICTAILDKVNFKPGVNKLIIEFDKPNQQAFVIQMNNEKEISNHIVGL